MQYPVPQFTDVEDRIIGPLTLKQFGIIFGAGVVVMLVYSISKNLLITIFFGIIVGLPAVFVAFGKFNGRPVYSSIFALIKFITSPKELVFHKEVNSLPVSTKVKNVDLAPVKAEKKEEKEQADPREKLKAINRLLQEQAQKEKELVKKL